MGSTWFYGLWPAGKKCNIAMFELYPISVALMMLDGSISDTVINIYTNNQALVSVLNRLRQIFTTYYESDNSIVFAMQLSHHH